MFDIFILCDQQIYEVSMRGDVTGLDAASGLSDVIGRLPTGAEAVIDLTSAASIDLVAAEAIRSAILARRVDHVTVVVAADLLALRSVLVLADVDHVAEITLTLAEARRLAGLAVAA